LTDNESKRVVRGKGSDWRLLKAGDASSHCVCPGILTGYRPALDYLDCFRSILRIHNETVNIWSHLVGFTIFTVALAQHLTSDIPKAADWIDHTSRIFQIFSYQVCMIASVLFHTFLCHSPSATRFWLSCDRAGILFSLFATYLRVLAKTFPCHPLLRATHLVIVCLLFTSVALQLFGKKKEGSAPIVPFMGIALYAAAPILHSAIVSESPISIASIAWLFLPHLQAGLGVLVYLLRFPENLLPAGTVDLWGSSHQLWHALIFSGMLSWYFLDPKEAEGNICF
jgi:adiponectin receptor